MKLLSWVWYAIFKRRHKGSLEDLPKLTEVVMSVDSAEHCAAAEMYVTLYVNKHLRNREEDAYTITGRKVIDQMLKFLADTAQHCESGYHTPEWNEHQPVRKYPHMNDYVGRVLNVRFKPFWTRGESSIAGPK